MGQRGGSGGGGYEKTEARERGQTHAESQGEAAARAGTGGEKRGRAREGAVGVLMTGSVMHKCASGNGAGGDMR